MHQPYGWVLLLSYLTRPIHQNDQLEVSNHPGTLQKAMDNAHKLSCVRAAGKEPLVMHTNAEAESGREGEHFGIISGVAFSCKIQLPYRRR